MQDRVLGLHAAAKRLRVPERTLRYRASRGQIEGAFKQGKLWRFRLSTLESANEENNARQDNRNNFDGDTRDGRFPYRRAGI